MADDFENSVFWITSAKEKSSTYGNGFLIHIDDNDCYVLTCRHVLDDVGGKDFARVASLPVKDVIIKSDDSPDDLAVLKISRKGFQDTFPNAAPLKLMQASHPGVSVFIPGFILHSSKKYKFKPISACVTDSSKMVGGGYPHKIKTWDLEINSSNKLEKGYSGSPVIDQQTRTVLGVAAMKEGDAKGDAICITTLADVWTDMPDGIIIRDRTQKNLLECVLSRKDLYKKTCDRRDHVNLFQKFFEQICKDEIRRQKPQFYFICGLENERHVSLIDRLKILEIPESAKKIFGKELENLPISFKAPVPKIRNPEIHENALLEDLFKIINGGTYSDNLTPENLCRIPSIKDCPIVIIIHDLAEDVWKPHYRNLLTSYIHNFWGKVSSVKPMFLIFFTLEYTNQPAACLKKWINRLLKKPCVSDEFKALSKTTPDQCLMLPEIESMDKHDVISWCRYHQLEEEKWKPKVDEYFKGKSRECMEKIEGLLEDILNLIDLNAFNER